MGKSRGGADKQVKALIQVVEGAGGWVKRTKSGHFMVHGPDAVVLISSSAAGKSTWKNTISAVRRAGIEV